MDTLQSSFSPHILIYFEIGSRQIRLSDVLYDSATVYEPADVPPGTRASLVFSIDGKLDREDVVLTEGLSSNNSIVRFQYADTNRPNGRHFAL
jgi:hypothetical protein